MPTANDASGPGESAIDAGHMRSALALARRGLGRVWPNPAVGCILVKNQVIVGRGWTQAGGRPHAEAEALARAGTATRGSAAYVTLEPCAHHGFTGPCCEALITAGIARAVVAVEDPDPRVSGRGIAHLRAAGIDVTTGVCAEEAAEINQGFFLRIAEGRPLITLKLATSLDGRIATASGNSKWITGDDARAHSHRLRAEHDAVLVGSATALTDDPALTCRLPGMSDRSPVRVIADGRLRLPLSALMVRSARDVPTWVLTLPTAGDGAKRTALVAAGAEVLDVAPGADGRLDPLAMAHALGARGITRLLVEGGGVMAVAFLRARLIDRITWFTAPRLLGADGVPSIAALGLACVDQAPKFRLAARRRLGDDLLAEYVRDT